MEKKSRKSIIISVTTLILIMLILLGLTYAYYRTRVIENSKEKSVSILGDILEVSYIDGTSSMNMTGAIVPGFVATKEFSVKNTGTKEVKYNIQIENVKNTFTRTADWSYKLAKKDAENPTCDDGETVCGTVPSHTSFLKSNISIEVSEVQDYILTVEYADLKLEDQSVDMGAEMSFKVNISEGTMTWDDATEGTLIYAIKNSNEVSEPLTTPGQFSSGYQRKQLDVTISVYTQTLDSAAQTGYWTYGTGYEWDPVKGYTITGVTTTSKTYEEVYEELNNTLGSSDIVMPSALSYKSTKDEAEKIVTSELKQVYLITSFSSAEMKYKIRSSSVDSVGDEALLASTVDDYGTSYYFRGAVTNNFVNYSGMCWRIVRVLGNGTIKLALADENYECSEDVAANEDGTYSGYNSQNNTSALIDGNTTQVYDNYLDSKYSIDFATSLVPNILDEWADRTEKTLDTSKLESAIWCHDTSIYNKLSDGTVYYGAYKRLYNQTNASPSLECNFTGIDDSKATTYERYVGLLTADEFVFAGYVGSYTSYLYTNSYLKTNTSNNDWTMTPYVLASGNTPRMFITNGNYLTELGVGSSSGSIRPAVVLKSGVLATGSGTQNDPYVIS